MPLVRVDLAKGKPEAYRRAIGDAIYEAMISALNVPKDDRFMVITEHEPAELSIDRTYLGIKRTDDCILVQVTLNAGRTIEIKKAFYQAVAKNIHARTGLRMEDIVINLVEVPKENWSFGLGNAQYAP
jgi:phenylpyruvate tautomerase PptA (4-oxalocrotonate tautomerase family)